MNPEQSKMSEAVENNDGFSVNDEVVEDMTVKTFICDVCAFTNSDIGGMKRHIKAKHRTTASKRSHGDGDGDDNDEREEKRPKIDEVFEPDLASTQISDDDDLDEFDEVLLAEQNDNDDGEETFGISDETLANLGNDTNFVYQDKERVVHEPVNTYQDVISSVLQADIAILNARIKAIERESSDKGLRMEQMVSEIHCLTFNLTECSEAFTALVKKLVVKNEAIEAGLARINLLDNDEETNKSKRKKLEEELEEKSNRIKLLSKNIEKAA